MTFGGLFWIDLWFPFCCGYLWLLTWQCLDHLQECALFEFYFPSVSARSREIHGSFPSLSPFPAHLLWFTFICFEGQRHRALCPDFNSSAREWCLVHAWCLPQGWPTQKWSWAAVDWLCSAPKSDAKLGFVEKQRKKINFMRAMYFVINANIYVPVFFLGVGGRVGMCHSWCQLGVSSWYPFTWVWCLLLWGRLLRGRKWWKSKEDGGQQEKLNVRYSTSGTLCWWLSGHASVVSTVLPVAGSRGIAPQKHPQIWKFWVESGDPGVIQGDKLVVWVSGWPPKPVPQWEGKGSPLSVS